MRDGRGQKQLLIADGRWEPVARQTTLKLLTLQRDDACARVCTTFHPGLGLGSLQSTGPGIVQVGLIKSPETERLGRHHPDRARDSLHRVARELVLTPYANQGIPEAAGVETRRVTKRATEVTIASSVNRPKNPAGRTTAAVPLSCKRRDGALPPVVRVRAGAGSALPSARR